MMMMIIIITIIIIIIIIIIILIITLLTWTLKMTTAQTVETSVTFNNNSTSPIQDTFTRTIKLNLYF